jgi:hypothetical protein
VERVTEKLDDRLVVARDQSLKKALSDQFLVLLRVQSSLFSSLLPVELDLFAKDDSGGLPGAQISLLRCSY